MLLNFECDHQPSLKDAAKALGIAQSAIDSQFGVVAIDPDQGLYTVRVDDDRAAEEAFDPDRGPFSDPRIAPMR